MGQLFSTLCRVAVISTLSNLKKLRKIAQLWPKLNFCFNFNTYFCTTVSFPTDFKSGFFLFYLLYLFNPYLTKKSVEIKKYCFQCRPGQETIQPLLNLVISTRGCPTAMCLSYVSTMYPLSMPK